MINLTGTDVISIKYVDPNGKIKAERTLKNKTQEDFELEKNKSFEELLEEIHMNLENNNGISTILLIQSKKNESGELAVIRR